MTTSRFKLWRQQEGLSLREVADLTGVSVPMLSLVERGQRTLSRRSKVAISRRLHTPISELFEIESFLEITRSTEAYHELVG